MSALQGPFDILRGMRGASKGSPLERSLWITEMILKLGECRPTDQSLCEVPLYRVRGETRKRKEADLDRMPALGTHGNQRRKAE